MNSSENFSLVHETSKRLRYKVNLLQDSNIDEDSLIHYFDDVKGLTSTRVNKLAKSIVFNISKDIHFKNSQTKEIQTNIINLTPAVCWNKELKKLTKNDMDVKLSKKEILIVDFLIQITEKTRTVEELISYVWNDEKYSSPTVINLNNIIARLRKKIPEVDIENVYGFGYRINIH